MTEREYPYGLTVAGGRYRLESLLRGAPQEGLWKASSVALAGRPTIVTLRRLRYSKELDALLRYSGPGIAAPLFIGPPDLFDEDGEEVRDRHTCMVDEQPTGADLANAGQLSADETVALGVSLCDAIIGWAATHEGTVTRGLRPETIFLAGGEGQRRFSGATPRPFFLLGNEGPVPAYPRLSFDPPAASMFEYPPSDALFTVATIL